MQIGQTYKKPSNDTKPFFDGKENENAEFSFLCGSCRQPIKLDLWRFLNNANGWEQHFSVSDITEIKREIKFTEVLDVIKSHEGGQPYLALSPCEHCSHRHLVYVGFYEFQPARYFGTLQGLYEVVV